MRHFKHSNKLIADAFAAVLAGTATSALAEQAAAPAPNTSGYGPGMMNGYGQGYGPGARGGAARNPLSLTEDQRTKINTIQNQTRKTNWALMGEIQDQQAKIGDLSEAPAPDNAAIEAAEKNRRRNSVASVNNNSTYPKVEV